MKYPEIYIYPPRPSTVIKFGGEIYERLKTTPGWIAQLKLNGQRSGEYFNPNGTLTMWNRHKESHKNFKLPSWLDAELRSALKPKLGTWTIFDSELLHAKDASVKNTFYLYDLLVFEGEWLVGKTYGQRHEHLMQITGSSETNLVDGYKYQISEHIWVARNLPAEMWDGMWKLTATSWIEGFVFKNLHGKLLPGLKTDNNSEWQIRCRKRSESGHIRY